MKVFSFCLYGPPNPRYYPVPLLQNIWLIGTYYPDFKVYIYAAPDVDQGFLDQVVMYSNVVLRPTGKLGAINMTERFTAIDEPDVDVMFVRDADSHVHWKDRWAINDFLSKPEFPFHIIRDNWQHTMGILGGLWGIRKSAGIAIRPLLDEFATNPSNTGAGYDQGFLKVCIYPKVISKSLIHRSDRCEMPGDVNVVLFPFEYSEDIYCGRCDEGNFIDTPQPPPRRSKPVYRFLKFS
jgi:hypothetical protein